MATGSFTPEELQFLSEDAFVTIIPNREYPTLYLLAGDVGPMEAALPVQVPLWLAISMKKRKQCRLEIPDWLNVDSLLRYKEIELEKENEKKFTTLPEFFVEHSQIILEHFAEDLVNCVEIRRIVKDIVESRLSKLRTSVDEFVKGTGVFGGVHNLTQMELSSMRNLVTRSMDQLEMLRKAGEVRAPLPVSTFGSMSVGNTTNNTNSITRNSGNTRSFDAG